MLDETTYYITAFAVDSNDAVIGTQQTTITTEFGWHPSANTLFYIKNDGEISDHSQYSHVMNWIGTEKYATLSNGRKVVDFDGTNQINSDTFTESIGKTTFTMHCWVKQTSTSATSGGTICGWMGRGSSFTTTDRWGSKWQNDNGRQNPFYIIYGPNNSSNWIQNQSVGTITLSTSEFYLVTLTVNGNQITTYKNGVIVGQRSGSIAMKGGSAGLTTFYMGGTGGAVPMYIGETVLEDKVETVSEIQDFYNKTKNHYA